MNDRQGSPQKLAIFWLRRDLRLKDNAGLYQALRENAQVLPIFIFDHDILSRLRRPYDLRVQFIWQVITELRRELQELGSDLLVLAGSPLEQMQLLPELLGGKNLISAIYTNHDYEPSAMERDAAVSSWARTQGIQFKSFKDQVIFEKNEILTDQKRPYSVYTPYKKKWLSQVSPFYLKSYPSEKYLANLCRITLKTRIPTLDELGFASQDFQFRKPSLSPKILQSYEKNRDFPALGATTHLGPHLRFGTLSVRQLARLGQAQSSTWLSELIWREFFMQILFHYPQVVEHSFRPEYDRIQWRKNKKDLELWKTGQTGYPLVDAGMRELAETGFMHNRVRMATASFLTKHLLIDWREGERHFAEKLLDFDLAVNNGNWQWAAGTGCDAAPYFRIFNPTTQLEKFDPDQTYIKKWIPEFATARYPEPMVDHRQARERCLMVYRQALKGTEP